MSKLLLSELKVLQKRKVPDTDPRVKAIYRTLQRQEPEQIRRAVDNKSQRRKIK